MKTLNQIYRYTADCRFSDEDWQRVLEYCRKRFKGGKIHKALYPKADSTYKQFRKWIETGLYGDSTVEVLSGLTEGERVILR